MTDFCMKCNAGLKYLKIIFATYWFNVIQPVKITGFSMKYHIDLTWLKEPIPMYFVVDSSWSKTREIISIICLLTRIKFLYWNEISNNILSFLKSIPQLLLYGEKLLRGECFANFAIFVHFRESLTCKNNVWANSQKLIPPEMD